MYSLYNIIDKRFKKNVLKHHFSFIFIKEFDPFLIIISKVKNLLFQTYVKNVFLRLNKYYTS